MQGGLTNNGNIDSDLDVASADIVLPSEVYGNEYILVASVDGTFRKVRADDVITNTNNFGALANCAFFINPGRVNYIFSDTGGTTPVVLDGTAKNVAAVTNFGTAGGLATQSDANETPSVNSAETYNGQTYLTFNHDFLSTSTIGTGSTTWTQVWVFEILSLTERCSFTSRGATYGIHTCVNTDGSLCMRRDGTNDFTTAAGLCPTNELTYVIFRYEQGQPARIYYDDNDTPITYNDSGFINNANNWTGFNTIGKWLGADNGGNFRLLGGAHYTDAKSDGDISRIRDISQFMCNR